MIRNKLIELTKYILNFFNISILNKNNYENIIQARNDAVVELADLGSEHFTDGVSCIVFSRDRAIQLFSLLESYAKYVKNPCPITVIYSCSSKEHEGAYADLIALKNSFTFDITFVKEFASFRDTLLATLEKVLSKNIFFLVDDIIFIQEFDLAIAEKVDTKKNILSLRLSPHLSKSYTKNQRQSPPVFKAYDKSELLEFSWFEKGCEWSTPWSLDGHIFSTSIVRVICKISSYSAPNTLENAFGLFNGLCKGHKGICFKNTIILNLPINRVQDEYNNISGNVSSNYLLKKWQEGLKFDFKKLHRHRPQSPHEEHSLPLIKRNEH